jgi:hypothetical protein
METLGQFGDLALGVLFIGGWFVMMRFVLPRLGVST